MLREIPWFSGILGGTLFATLPGLSHQDLRTTVIMAVVGALVSYCTTLIFREFLGWLQEFINGRDT